MEAQQKYDVLVVGGGISGLSMAFYCAQAGLCTLVLEKAERAGGCLATMRLPGSGARGEEPFWLELGAHSCFNSYGNLLEILYELGLTQKLIRKSRLPYRFLVGESLRSPLSQLHVGELLLSLPRFWGSTKAGHSVAEYYSRIVGERNYRELFSPAFAAVLCQSADDFPAALLFRPKPRRKDILRSFTLPSGLQEIPEALIALGPRFEISHKQVTAVEREGSEFVIHSAERSWRSDALVLATPPPIAGAILERVSPQLSLLLKGIETTEFDSVGVALRKQQLKWPPLGGVIARDESFFSVVSRDPVAHDRFRGLTFHFRPGVEESAREQKIADLLGIDPVQWTAVGTARHTLPSLQKDHGQRLEKIELLLAETRALYLTGNYFLGVSIEDCVERSRREFDRLAAAAGTW